MTETQHVVVRPDTTGQRLTIEAATGRLSKTQSDGIRCLLRGASVVKAVSRCRRGRLSVEIEGVNALGSVIDLIVRDETSIEKRARREAERRDVICSRRERREKVFLADAGQWVDDSPVLHLLDEQAGVALSRELAELDDPMPIFAPPTMPQFQLSQELRVLEAQLATA